MVSKRHIPWFDERIQSAALGRSLQVQHMHAKGLGFVVHPGAYIMQPATSQDGSQAWSSTVEASDVRAWLCLTSLSCSTPLPPCCGFQNSAWLCCIRSMYPTACTSRIKPSQLLLRHLMQELPPCSAINVKSNVLVGPDTCMHAGCCYYQDTF